MLYDRYSKSDSYNFNGEYFDVDYALQNFLNLNYIKQNSVQPNNQPTNVPEINPPGPSIKQSTFVDRFNDFSAPPKENHDLYDVTKLDNSKIDLMPDNHDYTYVVPSTGEKIHDDYDKNDNIELYQSPNSILNNRRKSNFLNFENGFTCTTFRWVDILVFFNL